VPGAPPGNAPPTRSACQARIAELQDDIAAIKAQIAAADLDRQARERRMDPRWFHRAKTALRHRQRELAEVTAHMARLPAGPSRQSRFKDALIEVLREDYDDEAWQRALTEAKRLQLEREGG
jgi:hypothetical protein